MTPRRALLLPFAVVACNALFGIDPPTDQDAGDVVDGSDVVDTTSDMVSPCGIGITSDGGIGYADISAGQPAESGHTPKALVDTQGNKLLVVTEDGSNQSRPGLFRCNLDGTCCTYRDISTNLGPRTGFTPAAIIDEVNHKLLVAAVNSATSFVNLIRCELDGSGCTASDISGGVQGQSPAIAIDDASSKLLVVTITQDLRLARCELDGSQCAYSDLGGWHYFGSGPSRPSVAVDAANAQLVIAVGGSLLLCDLDGSNPQTIDLAAGLAFDAGADGGNASELIDVATSTLLVAESSTSDRAALFRAALDGGNSTFLDISAGQLFGSGYTPSAVLDPTSGKLLVATIKKLSTLRFEPALYRCDTDGTNCAYIDINAAHSPFDGGTTFADVVGISSVVDTIHRRLLVVATDSALSNRPGLFALDL